MRRKPIIGIVPFWNETKKNTFMIPEYIHAVIQAGGLPVILPLTENVETFFQAVDMCSGFLLTGGQEASPDLHTVSNRNDNISCCSVRDKLEVLILDRAIQLDLPLLGIGKGLPFMNVALGGTLCRDIPRKKQMPPCDPCVREVMMEQDTPLAYLFNSKTVSVNGGRYQEIGTLSPILKCMARSADGATEAVYMPRKRMIWAVQWHPERTFQTDENSIKVFDVLVTYANLNI